MANIVDSIILTLRADPALIAAVGASSIREDIEAGDYPALCVEELDGPRDGLSRGGRNVQILFTARVAPEERSTLKTIQDRLADLFQDRWGDTVGTGADTIRVVASEMAGGGEAGIGKPADGVGWILKETYSFLIPS